MYRHCVFGGTLGSEFPFPELRSSDAEVPTWTLRRTDLPALNRADELLGEDRVYGEVRVRLFRTREGLRLVYDDTGSFQISEDGSEIGWQPAPQAQLAAARLDVIGRVLATCLHASGALCLHGSAVALRQGGIAFVAPKFHGKSTLAQALVSAGGRLVTDDAIPVELRNPPRISPGVHRVRLWADSAARVAEESLPAATEGDAKHTLDFLPDEQLMLTSAPFRAVYLLSPFRVNERPVAAERVRLPSVPAALSLVRHATIGPLLGGTEAAVLLRRAAVLAERVPVYSLAVVRDYEQLGNVVQQLMAWHGAEAEAETPTDNVPA